MRPNLLPVAASFVAGALVFPTIAYVVMGNAFGFDEVQVQNLVPAAIVGGVSVATIVFFMARSRKLYEEKIQLDYAKKLVEQSNQAKSDFLAAMSHELRTPMNAILGFGQLLKINPSEPLSAVQQEHIGYILKSGNHLLGLIDQVLELSKIDAGELILSIEDVDASEVAEESLAFVQTLAADRDIDLSFATPDARLPLVRADHGRLLQVLLNLLSNAIKYNRTGGTVVVSISQVSGGLQRISVKDTGRGVPTETGDELYEPFNRLDHETGDIEGTGIGLTITKKIVEAMNGAIGFESTPSVGSTFWVDLPVSEHQKKVSEVSHPLTPAVTPSTSGPHVGTILYVEDNPANVDLMQAIIELLPGMELITAHTAEIGHAMARDRKPNLIIMDINLPGMDGLMALKILRRDSETQKIPVIALSAAAMPRDIEAANKAGFDAYITKPIEIATLRSAIDRHLQR